MNTIRVIDICNAMDDWAPPALAYPWDRIGLQTGNPTDKVEKALVCLTVTRDALRAAKKINANMIIAHHPLIWDPLKTLREDDPAARLCLDLARANIACFTAHTNLDIAPGGVNDALADALGVLETRPLFSAEHLRRMKIVTFVPESHRERVRDALADAGAGVIGDYTHCAFNAPGVGNFLPGPAANPYLGEKSGINEESEWRIEMAADKARLTPIIKALYRAHPYEEPAFDVVPLDNPVTHQGLGLVGLLERKTAWSDFVARVAKTIGSLQVYGERRKAVRRVALLGGSGGSYVERLPGDVDVYVTGDISYHEAQAALLRGVSCIDAGHAGTELPVLDVIARRLKRAFPGLGFRIYKEPPMGRMVSLKN